MCVWCDYLCVCVCVCVGGGGGGGGEGEWRMTMTTSSNTVCKFGMVCYKAVRSRAARPPHFSSCFCTLNFKHGLVLLSQHSDQSAA